jgi:Flp pilus assembly protein TadD
LAELNAVEFIAMRNSKKSSQARHREADVSNSSRKLENTRTPSDRSGIGSNTVSQRTAWPNAVLAAAILAIAIGAVYARAIDAPFIFDDLNAIHQNGSIRSLWPLVGTAARPGPLNPPDNKPTSARPLVNLSLAINYHFGRLSPTGYHVVNVAIHFLSALLVWAIVRRSLGLPYFAGRFDDSATWLALAVAMLWALHPLVTEAVAYTTQRSELLVSLFYLATVYCSLRYWLTDDGGTKWLVLAVASCLCGMASKEIMVSAPIMVLLFDRTFIAGTFREALRKSWPLYAGLAGAWLLLFVLNIDAPRSGAAGFGLGVKAHQWWLTQCQVLLTYLKLSIWPYPLLIHYQWPYLNSIAEAWPYVLAVGVLAIATLVLLWRNSPLGFLGAWIFAILGPTFIVPVVLEQAAERRMYLPLVALVTMFVIGGYWLLSSLSSRWTAASFWLAAAIAVVLGIVSNKRLAAYYDEMHLWRDVVKHNPNDYVAHSSLGQLLLQNRPAEAIPELQAALQLKPDHVIARTNLGTALIKIGRPNDAISVLRTALKLDPNHVPALVNLGIVQMRVGDLAAARACFEHVLRLQPKRADIHSKLGVLLHATGQTSAAIEHCRQAVRLTPDDAEAHSTLGLVLLESGDANGAVGYLREAVRLQPDSAEYKNDLATALKATGQATQHQTGPDGNPP